MIVACLDMEGVLTPEIWINVAEKTGIDALRRTTRDEPDYDVLMRGRLKILDEHGLGIREIAEVIDTLDPLEGAVDFLDWLRSEHQLIILSDTFYPFGQPLVRKMGDPTVFCHDLVIDASGRITDYRLRMPDQKRASVNALKSIGFSTIAAGDSYNDTSMLEAADAGILFCPPQNVIDEFPQYPVTQSYDELRQAFESAAARIEKT